MTQVLFPTNGDAEARQAEQYDVVIVGAGITGLYQLHAIRQLGLSVRLLEAGGDVGGTWYWNRYPGCRLDSESYTYQYLFDEELLSETVWSEIFAGQPELERYIQKFSNRFDLRRDIQFNTRVTSMAFDEANNAWALNSETGEVISARFVICATGILSAPNYPTFPGAEEFKGEFYHTGLWPEGPVQFAGKRVAVIGTGASGVQLIPVVAEAADSLTVFQRTANWAVPLRNAPLDEAGFSAIRADYPKIFERVRSTSNGFVHDWDSTPFASVSEEDRLAKYEELWNSPGFAKWFGTYRDIAIDLEANRTFSDFVASKIRARLDDPAVADALIPTDHPYGTKRVPCETQYYEAYNRPNVELIQLSKNPILSYTATGLLTEQGPMDFDMIILATGFDAFTGALSRIDIRGVGGVTLRDRWKEGPQTYMGIQVPGLPNLLINGGPHGKGGIGNSPRCAEPVIHWLANLVAFMRENGFTRVEADSGFAEEWTKQVGELASKTLSATVKNYSFGDNIPGKPHVYVAYAGPLPEFVELLDTTASQGYPGYQFN
ncbi:MAG: Phenylacetone monooxygenase [Nitrospira sp.]|nr:Phenylacetone monooxygenase [Nitrospira sp.]